MNNYVIRFVHGCIALVFIGSSPLASELETAPNGSQIWFCPTLSKVGASGVPFGSRDYEQLFDDGAAWRDVYSRISVFKTYLSHVVTVSDEQLKKEMDFLNRHKIKFALEFGPMNREPEGCGAGIEGWGNGGVKTALSISGKIRKAGGILAYVAMDEPFWGDRFANSANACHLSDRQMAENAFQTMRAFQKVFPNVQFGDIEPLQSVPTQNLVSAYAGWLDAWKEVTGSPLSFFHLDVMWDGDVTQKIGEIGRMIESKGTRFGLIYNGNTRSKDSESWLNQAKNRYVRYEVGSNPRPQDVIFQSWAVYPDTLLPEDSPLTHTHLVKEYLLRNGGILP